MFIPIFLINWFTHLLIHHVCIPFYWFHTWQRVHPLGHCFFLKISWIEQKNLFTPSIKYKVQHAHCLYNHHGTASLVINQIFLLTHVHACVYDCALHPCFFCRTNFWSRMNISAIHCCCVLFLFHTMHIILCFFWKMSSHFMHIFIHKRHTKYISSTMTQRTIY